MAGDELDKIEQYAHIVLTPHLQVCDAGECFIVQDARDGRVMSGVTTYRFRQEATKAIPDIVQRLDALNPQERVTRELMLQLVAEVRRLKGVIRAAVAEPEWRMLDILSPEVHP